MKNEKVFIFLFIIGFIFLGCLTESSAENDDDIVDEISGDPREFIPETANPHRENFDVVIVDQDGWEICLNVNREKRYAVSFGSGYQFGCRFGYDAHNGCSVHGINIGSENYHYSMLWHQMGSYTFVGNAEAVFDPIQDSITVSALDYGEDTGHIIYSLKFTSGNELQGVYVYSEYPRRTNSLTARLVQGELGEHLGEGF